MNTKWIPSALTLLNLLCGMFSLVFSVEGDYKLAGGMILLATILDGLDGRTARYFNATSEFGKELDSLADLVSFGVAPVMALYMTVLRANQKLLLMGWLIITIFVLCGAFRLARFNIQNIKGYFVGIPITFAGSLIALLIVILGTRFPYWLACIVVLVLAFMMASRFRIPKI